jgi:hypothetical protein
MSIDSRKALAVGQRGFVRGDLCGNASTRTTSPAGVAGVAECAR